MLRLYLGSTFTNHVPLVRINKIFDQVLQNFILHSLDIEVVVQNFENLD